MTAWRNPRSPQGNPPATSSMTTPAHPPVNRRASTLAASYPSPDRCQGFFCFFCRSAARGASSRPDVRSYGRVGGIAAGRPLLRGRGGLQRDVEPLGELVPGVLAALAVLGREQLQAERRRMALQGLA